MKFSWRDFIMLLSLFSLTNDHLSIAQDYDNDQPVALPPAAEHCNGIYVSYDFISRAKEYPHVKNVSAQSWAFKAKVTVLNTGTYELKSWKIFIGFQHEEILVSASGAVLMDGNDFPAPVGNGTYLSGYPQSDLKTSIDTAGDLSQIQVQVKLAGTQFGVKPLGIPMPKTIKLVNDGYKCPAPTNRKTSMYVCCPRNPKYKVKDDKKTKYLPRQKGDLLISYDVTQAYGNNYLALVTLENNNPLGRLDHWNLTWEWMRGEFINTMRGAYTRSMDSTDCIYGAAGQYYTDMDFSKVMNCQKKPIIGDLPRERTNDTQVGMVPHCCRNGSILPAFMDPSQSKSAFQVQVYKLPPDLNRTALYPPQKWKIVGALNPDYNCGPPIRVSPTAFPDPSGLQAETPAIASWQVVCNISRPKQRNSRCCVSFSAYYNASVIPCDTCACGCDDTTHCNQDAPAVFLPAEALLVPFENRTEKAIAWAKLKHFNVPKPLPCGDNCGVSINWHVSTDYRSGWSARMTLFNWREMIFENWFVAVQLKKASRGYENVYSFNGTFLSPLNQTIFFQGIPGLNYLMGEVNGTDPKKDARVPGKQQSVISFTKKQTPGISISEGDGFPSKVFFNGEECALPTRLPTANGNLDHVNSLQVILLVLVSSFMLMKTNH
ncbi:COBRA domain-containing protein [Cephalotus follicularis]|uniref:COBRA domain-containing protein n=1 Tax=Cephalotus follicularis TaxID=3775 RepID=A0A1Q3DD88_CEPFO|nr:COBRA domain-containing protein [Cephalotus follicularis]